VLLFVSAQSVMVVHAALTRGAAGGSGLAGADASAEPGVVGEIGGVASVFLEDLTWIEGRTLINQGITVAIVPTGGTEQNGPHLILGKHNYIVRHAAGEIARRLGNALVAPVIAYVPEGNIDPPSGHMRYAGTLSVPEAVFETVLEHTARSLKAHGFKLICFVGESGGNQKSQQRIADRLNRQWRDSGARVLHVGEYYFGNGQIDWLTDRGETRASIGTHAGIRDTSELLYVHPDGVRGNLLTPSSSSETTGADGDPSRASTGRGEILVNLKVSAAVRQIKEELARMAARPAPSRPRPYRFAVSL
jgi:creatinine amidohydrolase